MDGQVITIANDAQAIHAARKAELDAAVADNDWETILTKCPVRESAALANISGELGFRRIEDYEKAVRRLLSQDNDALAFVRGLFGNLFDQLDS
jgi:hypothetical protein